MRFGLAAFGAVLIGGIAVGLAVVGSTDSTKSSQLHVRRAVAAGAPVSQAASHSSSPAVPTVQVAHGVLITPPLRDMRPTPGRLEHGVQQGRRALAGRERRSSEIAPGQRARPAQRAEEPDAGADRELRGRQQRRTAPLRRTPRATSARTTTCSGSTSRSGSTTSNGTPATPVTPGYQLFTGQPHLRNPVRERRRPDRPLRPVRGPLDREPARVSDLSERAVLPVRRVLVRRATRRARGARTSTSRTRRTSTTIRSSASGRPSTRT